MPTFGTALGTSLVVATLMFFVFGASEITAVLGLLCVLGSLLMNIFVVISGVQAHRMQQGIGWVSPGADERHHDESLMTVVLACLGSFGLIRAINKFTPAVLQEPGVVMLIASCVILVCFFALLGKSAQGLLTIRHHWVLAILFIVTSLAITFLSVSVFTTYIPIERGPIFYELKSYFQL